MAQVVGGAVKEDAGVRGWDLEGRGIGGDGAVVDCVGFVAGEESPGGGYEGCQGGVAKGKREVSREGVDEGARGAGEVREGEGGVGAVEVGGDEDGGLVRATVDGQGERESSARRHRRVRREYYFGSVLQ